jgi:tRNA modification GTPase
MHESDTITAIATPAGQGALGIIRISGAKAFSVADVIFRGTKSVPEFVSHTVHYGRIICGGEVIDNVLLVKMDAPHSYTGENTIEITCHGGRLVLHRILTAAIGAGARPAEPGEFTLRAFINGKMDLAQAEAVQQLISAENELALQTASRQLEGSLSVEINEMRKDLVAILAEVEAAIDFSEEDIASADNGQVLHQTNSLKEKITALALTYADGKRICEGVHVAIAGKPNVGKSSLLNALLEKDRAIITHLPGTTRDVIHESLIWQGITLRITDTAGIRKSSDIIEKEGIRRSLDAISHADLILLVIDASQPLSLEDRDVAEQVKGMEFLIVLNKCDLTPVIKSNPFGEDKSPRCVMVSALKCTNINELKNMIAECVWQNGIPTADAAIITNARHKNALDSAVFALSNAEESIRAGLSQEFTALHLRDALDALGLIVGKTAVEDILSEIFSKFCIGK